MTLVPLALPTAAPTHAVSRQRSARLAVSAKPYLARGSGLVRCAGCRLIASHCLCASRPTVPTSAGMCLIMGDIEAIKPTNTGWLVADVVADTWAFGWSRTSADPGLLALLADPQWQPYVVFPGEFVQPERVVTALLPASDLPLSAQPARKPLFVLLDGTWSEARKIFRKSPFLEHLPVLSLHPEDVVSSYRLRRSANAGHFCTAEVAALCLALAGETHAADVLAAWFDLFSERYMGMRLSSPLNRDSEAHQRLQALAGAGGVTPPEFLPTPAA
ncbi:tRNA-uridine aminocarboxypropyltransferase [Hydrogenophaga sp. IBVHS1]|uniref:tRNA-uridine aminocarboxypropyltransferase n=1 Tax=unclassified Hydrogenophaga TaxID=2610897 RepID=UPI000A2E9017|nr:tRNA-uridine aminocarboxypropyltransferase [Hydrogenophaga sp. IBVHS1]OSZ76165.1 DTW domain-containing protein [Hydrogenophaga sp. IBVHS1]